MFPAKTTILSVTSAGAARVAAMTVATAAIALNVGALGCDDKLNQVSLRRLTPEAGPECGSSADAKTLRITAAGDFTRTDSTTRSIEISLGEPLFIDSFPKMTRALEVEVLTEEGTVIEIGRSEAFDIAKLKDKGTIAIFMAPPNGVCPTGPPVHSRRGALAVVTGNDVIIAGGTDDTGRPISRPEIYLAREARFQEIDQNLFGDLMNGLAGASLTALPDRRLVLAGGALNAFQVYDPETRLFSEPPNLLSQDRAFHAAVALDESRIFFAGGCTRVLDGVCEVGTETQTTAILDVDSGLLELGPALRFVRVGPQAFLEPDGTVIVVGGANAGGPVLVAERIEPFPGGMSEVLDGRGQAGVRLASGALVTAFGPPGIPSGDGTYLPPGGTIGVPLEPALPRCAPTLTALESGRVLAYGGVNNGSPEAALLAPLSGQWESLETNIPTAGRRDHAATLLPDGSVLILGGRNQVGDHLGDALIFRPLLSGPLTRVVTINFADDSAEQIVVRDRSAATVVPAIDGAPAFLRIQARATDEGVPGEWAVVAAPILGHSEMTMTALSTGGLALISAFEEPTTFRVTTIVAGSPIRVLDVSGNNVIAVASCVGEIVSAAELAKPGRWRQVISTNGIELSLNGDVRLQCTAAFKRRGRVGVGPLGDVDSELNLFQLRVQR